jgi:hypothetical protein
MKNSLVTLLQRLTFVLIFLSVDLIAITIPILNSPILAEHKLRGQVISISGGQYTIALTDSSIHKVIPSNIDPTINLGKCGFYYDLKKFGGGQRLDSASCDEGMVEYGENDSVSGDLVRVSQQGSQSKVQLSDFGFLVVDEPSYSTLRQNTGYRFRYTVPTLPLYGTKVQYFTRYIVNTYLLPTVHKQF